MVQKADLFVYCLLGLLNFRNLPQVLKFKLGEVLLDMEFFLCAAVCKCTLSKTMNTLFKVTLAFWLHPFDLCNKDPWAGAHLCIKWSATQSRLPGQERPAAMRHKLGTFSLLCMKLGWLLSLFYIQLGKNLLPTLTFQMSFLTNSATIFPPQSYWIGLILFIVDLVHMCCLGFFFVLFNFFCFVFFVCVFCFCCGWWWFFWCVFVWL